MAQAIEFIVIELMIARDIDDGGLDAFRKGDGFLNAFGARADIAGQDDDVCADRRALKGPKFDMEVT
jgi:hypothetical protein